MSTMVGSLPLVGREDEVGVLAGAVEGAVQGQGSVVFINGEAGIGKTRLVEEITARAAQRECVIAVGTQDPIDEGRPFAVIADALGPLDPGGLGAAGADSGEGRSGFEFRVSDAYIDLIQRRCGTQPMVLVAENLHWADAASITTLGRLVRLTPQLNLVVVATARPVPGPDRLDQLKSLVSSQDGIVLNLAPLTGEYLAEIAETVLGRSPGPSLIARLDAAGGNPLLALELLRALTDNDGVRAIGDHVDLVADSPSIPIPLEILNGLGVVPLATLELLRQASVLGRTFTLDDFALVSEQTITDLADPMKAAMLSGILASDGDRLAFRHDLVWELLYDDLGGAFRTAMHRATAIALAAAGRSPDTVATHLLRGVHQTDDDDINRLVDTAHALRHGSPSVAVELLERARSLSATDSSMESTIRAEHALALLRDGRHREGQEACRAALDAGEPDNLRPRVRQSLVTSLTFGGHLEEASDICERALTVPSLGEAQKVGLQTSLAFIHLHGGHAERAASLADAAARDAAEIDQPGTVANARIAQATALSLLGRFSDAAESALEAISTVTEEDPSTFHFGHAIAGGRLAMVDRVDQAHDVLHAGLKLYERIGSASALTQYHVAMGECHFRHGAWDDAIAEFEATDGLTREGLAWPILTHGTLGVIAAHRNDLRLAQHHVDTATAAFEAGVAPYRYDLVLQAKLIIDDARRAQGPQDSQALTREVWQWLTAGSPTVGFLGAAHEIAYRMVTSGDHAGAEDVAMRMRGCADANPDAPSILGSALLSEGVAHDDVASLIAAVDAYRRGRQPVAHAFACETAADALLDASRDEEAHRLLTEARDLYRQLQASVDITRVDNRIAAAGLGEPDDGSERRPVTGWEALTPTEERVARYLVQRLSNPEIAEAMYISRRTVESHVSHILTKLGVDSRREVARLHAAR